MVMRIYVYMYIYMCMSLVFKDTLLIKLHTCFYISTFLFLRPFPTLVQFMKFKMVSKMAT